MQIFPHWNTVFWCAPNPHIPRRYCKGVNPLETSCFQRFVSKNPSIHQYFSAKVASKSLPSPWLRTPPFAAADSIASAAAEALPETAVDTATRWQLCARQSEVCICEARGRFFCGLQNKTTCFSSSFQGVLFSSNQIVEIVDMVPPIICGFGVSTTVFRSYSKDLDGFGEVVFRHFCRRRILPGKDEMLAVIFRLGPGKGTDTHIAGFCRLRKLNFAHLNCLNHVYSVHCNALEVVALHFGGSFHRIITNHNKYWIGI